MAWGTWRLKGQDVRTGCELLAAALESGITLIDLADVYGPDNGEPFGAAETLFGRVLAETPGLNRRLVLATKGGIELGSPYNTSADYLVSACEASLRRLGVERIDLYQIHRPDLLTHPAETAGALARLRDSGKIAEAGVSNHTPAQLAALQAHLPFKLVSVQPEFSPSCIAPLQDGVLDQALERGLAVLAWSPLGGGRVVGDADAEIGRELDRVAETLGVSRAVAAYAWIMQHPARPIPIVGSQRPERIREAATAVGLTMSRQDWYAILVAARGAPLP